MRSLMPALKHAALAVVAACAFLALQAALDYQDRVFAERAAYRKWVAESCVPTYEGDRAVASLRSGKVDCTIVSGGGYGRAAPVVVSAATMDAPQ